LPLAFSFFSRFTPGMPFEKSGTLGSAAETGRASRAAPAIKALRMC